MIPATGLTLAAAIHPLATLNAALNALALVLLVAGYVAIKRRRETLHTGIMLAAFAVSILFLASYLTYHLWVLREAGTQGQKFSGQGLVRGVYLTILVSHIILAAVVPFMVIRTIYLGWRDRRAAHVRLARWTFPIWLYVSVTGVLVYWMLYHLYPPLE